MQINESDQIDQGAYGRKLKPAVHPAFIMECKEHLSAKGRACVLMTFSIDATEENAPEGKVKVDYYVTPGQFSLKNFLEVFFPQAIGKKIDLTPEVLDSLLGKRVQVLTSWRGEVKNEDGSTKWKARAEVSKILPKAKDDATPDLVLTRDAPAEEGGENPF